MAKRPFNGSPTVDGYYTTFDSSEVHRVEESSDDQGGGSSDFSTAQVTFSITRYLPSNVVLPLASIDEDPDTHEKEISIAPLFTSGTFTVPLYEEKFFTAFLGNYNSLLITTSGNVTYLDGSFLITGDCTITIAQTALG